MDRKLNDDDLAELSRALPVPDPRPEAEEAAFAAAMAAFDEAQAEQRAQTDARAAFQAEREKSAEPTQGSARIGRLIGRALDLPGRLLWRPMMKNRKILAGVSVLALVVGFGLVSTRYFVAPPPPPPQPPPQAVFKNDPPLNLPPPPPEPQMPVAGPRGLDGRESARRESDDAARFRAPGEQAAQVPSSEEGRRDANLVEQAAGQKKEQAEAASPARVANETATTGGAASSADKQQSPKPAGEAVGRAAQNAPASSVVAPPPAKPADELARRQAEPKIAQPLPASPPDLKPEPVPQPEYEEQGRDRFERFADNPIKAVSEEPVSTLSVDVDTSSYAFMRKQLTRGVLPQKDAVRAEELINYFDYDYPATATREQPFSVTTDVFPAPWNPATKLLRIGIKGFEIPEEVRPKANLTFLVDVSGSMNAQDKLPLVQESLRMLVEALKPTDTVSLVVYAGRVAVVLEPTPVSERGKILAAIDGLRSGGSTAGAEGIRLAYEMAERNFDKNAVNRVILASDGDFNVGIRNPEELKGFVERKRKEGVFLSVLGFGTGNLNDQMMQALAQNGNGVAAYIDNITEARRVLVDHLTRSLFPIANDVKIQVEFNPARVAEYRLIGYETRLLRREDFKNDAVDAGDIGAGHTVTALYEIATPDSQARMLEQSRYAQPSPAASGDADLAKELANVRIRYKLPSEEVSKLIERPVTDADVTAELDKAPADARFAAAVAAFAQILRGGRHTGAFSLDDVAKLADAALKASSGRLDRRKVEFVDLVEQARSARGMERLRR